MTGVVYLGKIFTNPQARGGNLARTDTERQASGQAWLGQGQEAGEQLSWPTAPEARLGPERRCSW